MNRKQLYWSIGIATGIIGTTAILLRRRSKASGTTGGGSIGSGLLTAKEQWIKPVVAKISSPFGNRIHPVTHKMKFHNGIDLPVPVGTRVKSPMSGVVVGVSSGGDGGNQLFIRHSNGYTSGYSHLSKVYVKKGDKVKQGDMVALSGNTGRSTGPHVHLSLKDSTGTHIDPAKVIYA